MGLFNFRAEREDTVAMASDPLGENDRQGRRLVRRMAGCAGALIGLATVEIVARNTGVRPLDNEAVNTIASAAEFAGLTWIGMKMVTNIALAAELPFEPGEPRMPAAPDCLSQFAQYGWKEGQ